METIPLFKIKEEKKGGYLIKYISVVIPKTAFLNSLDRKIFCSRLIEKCLQKEKIHVFDDKRPGRYIDDDVYDLLVLVHDKKIYEQFELYEEIKEFDMLGNEVSNRGILTKFPKILPKLESLKSKFYHKDSELVYAPCFISGYMPLVKFNNDEIIKDFIYEAYTKTMMYKNEMNGNNFLMFFLHYLTMKDKTELESKTLNKLDGYVCVVKYSHKGSKMMDILQRPFYKKKVDTKPLELYGLMIGEFVWTIDGWVEYDELLNQRACVKKVMSLSDYYHPQTLDSMRLFDLARKELERNQWRF